MKKLLIVVAIVGILAALAGGVVYAAWETEYLLPVAAKVIEWQAPPWDVLDIRRVSHGRIYVVVTAEKMQDVNNEEFYHLWEVTAAVMRAMTPDGDKLMMAFCYPQGDAYFMPSMFVCPLEKTDYTNDEGCRYVPLFVMLPADQVPWPGR
jgi:hypothetical protein